MVKLKTDHELPSIDLGLSRVSRKDGREEEWTLAGRRAVALRVTLERLEKKGRFVDSLQRG